jgi:hypothetical protein
VLALSAKQRERRVVGLAPVGKIAEQEQVPRSQADRIMELEATCANFRRGKDKVTDGEQRLAEKYKSLTERAEHEKAKLAEAHATEVTQLHEDLDIEARSYIEYHLTIRRRLRDLHEAVASSFEKIKAQCMPFHDKGMKIEEMIDWVVGEVKAVPDTI